MIIKNNLSSLIKRDFNGEAVSLEIVGVKDVKNEDFWFRFEVGRFIIKNTGEVKDVILDIKLENLYCPKELAFSCEELAKAGIYFDKNICQPDKDGNRHICKKFRTFKNYSNFYRKIWTIDNDEKLFELNNDYLFSLAQEFVEARAYKKDTDDELKRLGFSKWIVNR